MDHSVLGSISGPLIFGKVPFSGCVLGIITIWFWVKTVGYWARWGEGPVTVP